MLKCANFSSVHWIYDWSIQNNSMSSPYCHKSNISISFLPVLSISLDRCLHKGTKVMAWVSFDIPLYKSDVIKSLKSNRVYILIVLCLFDLLIAIEFSFQQVQVILYNLACYNKHPYIHAFWVWREILKNMFITQF